MTETLADIQSGPGRLALCLLGGAVLGCTFFGGLQITVRRLPTAKQPVMLALSSFFLRAAVALAGFAWLGGGRWERYAAALVGFVMARLALVWLWGRPPTERPAE